MPKSKLNDLQKARVIELEQSGKVSQRQIANYFNVSPRTITRVLAEAGLVDTLNHLSDRDKDCLKLIRGANLSYEQLNKALSTPPLTTANVVQVVSAMDNEQLGSFLVSITKMRIGREAQAQRAREEEARTKEGTMHQEALV